MKPCDIVSGNPAIPKAKLVVCMAKLSTWRRDLNQIRKIHTQPRSCMWPSRCLLDFVIG